MRLSWLAAVWLVALNSLPASGQYYGPMMGVSPYGYYPAQRVMQYGFTTPYGAFYQGWSYGTPYTYVPPTGYVPGGFIPGGYVTPGGYVAGYAPGFAPAWGGAYVSTPLVLPAESLYGPQAVQRFMGTLPTTLPTTPPVTVSPTTPAATTVTPPPVGFGVLAGNGAGVAQPVVVNRPRASNDASKARALELLHQGDEHFRAQRYTQALSRYKDAAANAPDVAEAYFRQGWALTALGQLDNAQRSLRRGFELRSDWPNSPFQLRELYGDNPLVLDTHREALLRAQQDRPLEATPVYLLALFDYFRGERAAARTLFAKAKELELGDPRPIQAFLDVLNAAPPPMPRQ